MNFIYLKTHSIQSNQSSQFLCFFFRSPRTGGRTGERDPGGAREQTGHGGLHERNRGAPGARPRGAQEPNVPNLQNVRHQRGGPGPGHGLAGERAAIAEIASFSL